MVDCPALIGTGLVDRNGKRNRGNTMEKRLFEVVATDTERIIRQTFIVRALDWRTAECKVVALCNGDRGDGPLIVPIGYRLSTAPLEFGGGIYVV